MTTTVKTTPRVWIGALGAYNAGHLIGKWVDATDGADALWEAQREVIREAKARLGYEGGEEHACFDYEGFGSHPAIGEYTSLDTFGKLGELIAERGDAFSEWLGAAEPDLDDLDALSERFTESYRGEWESERAYAEHEVDEVGWAGIPTRVWVSESGIYAAPAVNPFEALSAYLDWDAIARELFDHGNLSTAAADGGKVYVFEAMT